MSKKNKKKKTDEFDIRCPGCHRPLSGQWDTESEEPYWHCDSCDESYCIDGITPAFYRTCVAEE